MIIAGTGHRNLGFSGTNPKLIEYVKKSLNQLLVQHKPEKILSGMAIGFDTLLAETAIDLGIKFDAVVPFKGQEKRWYPQDQQKYHQLLEKADNVIVVSDGGFDYFKMHKRNQYLVEHSDLIISYWDSKSKGGTYHCICYAKKLKRNIININPAYFKNE